MSDETPIIINIIRYGVKYLLTVKEYLCSNQCLKVTTGYWAGKHKSEMIFSSPA